MPLVITAVFMLAIVSTLFALYVRADNQARRDRSQPRKHTS